MKRTTFLIAVLAVTMSACAVAIMLAGHSTAPLAPPAGVRAWEYKVVHAADVMKLGQQEAPAGVGERMPFDLGMDSLGSAGWELVAVATPQTGPATYHFKRPR
jgi:hypothetical protein